MAIRKKTESVRQRIIKGWCAVSNYGHGKIVDAGDGPFHRTRWCGWSDDTRWVRATAIVLLSPPPKPKRKGE